MRLPLILINFKAYEQSVGGRGLKLARTCERVAKEYRVNIAVAPQHFDLGMIASKVRVPTFAQDIDAVEKPGSSTGHVVADNLKKIGIRGTLINHSEKQLPLREIKKRIEITKKVGITSVCCVPTIAVGKKVARYNPDFIAFEVPELIGSGRPISKERPDSVKKFVASVRKINRRTVPLCGAGISSGDDVKSALDLGTKGVLVASAVVKAKNPGSVLRGFALATK